MPSHLLHQARSRTGGLIRWSERLLVGGGVVTLIWCAGIGFDRAVAQRIALGALASAPHADAPPSAAAGPVIEITPSPGDVHAGSPIAKLSISRLQLSAAVLEGSDAQTLRRGPGHLENSARPGQRGNVVIAGHRDTFFWPLRNVALGDDVVLETPDQTFHYQVTSVRIVGPRDVSVLEPTGDATLTLITCYPFWVFGHAPDRFVVRATRTLGKAASDDDSRVRDAVERFRLAYNARLLARHEQVAAQPLAFDTCEISVDRERATATCHVSSPPSEEPQVPGRTFTLVRSGGEWAIKKIEVR